MCSIPDLPPAKAAEYLSKFKNMLTRVRCDKRKKSPFQKLGDELLGADLKKLEEGDPIAAITQFANDSRQHDKELKARMCPAVLDYHEKYHIGFFDRATRAAQHPDLEAATVLIDGANCIKSCFCPPSWNKHSKSRPAPSSAPLPRNIDRHHDNSGPPANRSEEEIAEVFRQTQEETQVEPLLRHARLQPALTFAQAVAAGWTYVFERFGIQQKSKIRTIDPACACNERSDLERSPPMATAGGVLASCSVARDPSLADKNVVILTKKRVKFGRSLEKKYEAAFVEFIEKGTPIPAELQKEVRSFDEKQKSEKEAAAGRNSDSSSKRRRVDPGVGALLLSIIMLVVDVHKACNSICVRKSHRQFNRFVIFNPVRKAWDFYESHTLTLGNVRSVVAWVRVGDAIRTMIIFFIGIMISVYVDDYPAPVPAHLASKAVAAVLHLFSTLGFAIHPDKVKVGTPLEVLGLIFDLACDAPNFFISLGRKDALRGLINKALQSRSLSIKEAEVLNGKLMFCLSALVDRQFNPVLKPLTQFINLPKCSQNGFSPKLERCLRSILVLLDQDTRKKSKFEDPLEESVMVYTDASWSHGSGWLAVVINVKGRFGFVVRRVKVRADEIISAKRSSPINFLELVTTILAVAEFRHELADCFFRISVDNEAAKSALLNQNSPSIEMAIGAVFFWSFASSRMLSPWVDRVPSGFNIADVPTRPEFLKFVQSNFPGVLDDVSEFSTSTKQLLPFVLTLSRPELFGVIEGIKLEDILHEKVFSSVPGCLISADDLD
mmetsp:Transcript_25312/g.63712  ORF Transcript_25312/g.63712 Transcript_25312/m.63712 type:complete len:778 (+) Transcript_25312:103-2436(+)|eukprot:g1495.t1